MSFLCFVSHSIFINFSRCFVFFPYCIVGTNALPIWTMTDLLQMNGNDLNNPLAPTAAPKTTTICPAAQLHTNKRQITATATKATKSSAVAINSNSNHKRSSSMDTNAHKRLKCGRSVILKMSESRSGSVNHQISDIGHIHPIYAANQMKSDQNRSMSSDTTAPHLLQHLMAPTPRSRKFNEMGGNASTNNMNRHQQHQQRWNGSDDDGQSSSSDVGGTPESQGGRLRQMMMDGGQSSNSVLKNLLVSGCDISAGYICAVPVRVKKTAKA